VEKTPKDQDFIDATPALTPVQKKTLGRVDASTRMIQLGYDPLGALIKQHNDISAELERQEKIRLGDIVELRQDGKAKAFNMDNVFRLRDQLIVIGDKLLRYGYGRVSENDGAPQAAPSALVVILNKDDTQFRQVEAQGQ
jgi:hypothetical protein